MLMLTDSQITAQSSTTGGASALQAADIRPYITSLHHIITYYIISLHHYIITSLHHYIITSLHHYIIL
jgi:hypothetical protein